MKLRHGSVLLIVAGLARAIPVSGATLLPVAVAGSVQIPGQSAAQGVVHPFDGSVATEPATPQALSLTLDAAIARALEHNLGILTLEQQVESARAARWRSLDGLLPSIDARTGETRQTTNLAAAGFDSSLFPGLPEVIGPFNVFDARVFVSQPLLDMSALNDLRASRQALAATRFVSRNARDVVVLVVTNLYLQAAAGANRIDAVRRQVTTAETLLGLANDRHDAGATPGIDVVRAKVQVQVQRQRLIAAENDFAKQKLQLVRAIGIPSAQPIDLADRDAAVPASDATLDQAIQRALASRADYQAVLARLHAAEFDRQAAESESLPSLHANVDVGAIGSSIGDARRTYSVSGVVSIPVFDATRRGRVIEAAGTLRERQAEANDFLQRVESEVRSAFLDVQAAEQQLAVARERVDLANQELTLAQTRFSAGVTSNLEVTQAQDEVATATENEIASLLASNVARAALARTIGSGVDPGRP